MINKYTIDIEPSGAFTIKNNINNRICPASCTSREHVEILIDALNKNLITEKQSIKAIRGMEGLPSGCPSYY